MNPNQRFLHAKVKNRNDPKHVMQHSHNYIHVIFGCDNKHIQYLHLFLIKYINILRLYKDKCKFYLD